jgi:hypothetical protein
MRKLCDAYIRTPIIRIAFVLLVVKRSCNLSDDLSALISFPSQMEKEHYR